MAALERLEPWDFPWDFTMPKISDFVGELYHGEYPMDDHQIMLLVNSPYIGG